MILRKLQWVLIIKLLYLTISVESQNERSYDTNDWIPVTPTPDANGAEASKQATGRVLNLDAPAQKFFPEAEYSHRKRKPQVQQYLRESSFKPSNDRHRQKNVDHAYRHEVQQQPQQSASNIQYLATYEQPPPLKQGGFIEKPILTRQQAPAVDALNIYEQYNLPFNGSFYQSLNPSSINQELQTGFQNPNNAPSHTATIPLQDERQSVQLLYVPLENLKPNQGTTQDTQDSETIFRQVDPPREENQIFSQNKQHLIDDIEHDLIQQTVQAHRLQQQIHLGRPVVLQTTSTTTTTPKPTKRKPHQPPLAVYLEKANGADVDDVIDALQDAKTVAVQDAVLPTSPRVFIGPSTLNLPSGYNRFPLPYINKLDVNRIERKIENLPFFVAPLSYKTPSGYSKIPLPSPHVGSVVVSNKEDSHKRSAPRPTPIYQNQINDYGPTKPSYSAPAVGDPNSQTFDPSQQTYFSTTPFLNPTADAQKPHYLQFTVNDKVNQYPVPSTPAQGQLQQPQLNIHNNNIPSRNPSQIPNTHTNTFTSPGSGVSHNQVGNQVNTNPQTASRQIVPETNINPYSSSLKTVDENINKYNFNQNLQNYQIPTRTSEPTSNTNHNTVNPYQIPVQTSPGVTQYSQLVDDKKENQYKDYTIPQSFPNENPTSYHVPSRSPQRSRHPTTQTLHNSNTPTRATTSHYDGPSASFLSSPFEDTHEINITPKTSSTTKSTTEEFPQYSFSGEQKKPNPLDLAINQYELHQINSQLVADNTERGTKDPFDFNSQFRYDGHKPKDFDYNTKFEEVERSKVKGKYGYSSIFDVDVDKPKYDYGSEFERYSSTPASILRDTFEAITTTPRAPPKSRRRGKPTRQPTRTTTTDSPLLKETYTVLEEFSSISSTSSNITEAPKEVKYESEYKLPTQPVVPDVPANVYRIRTTTPKYQIVKVDPVTTQYDNTKTIIEDIPANVYNLNANQQNTPIYTNPTNQQVLNQNIMDKQILQNNFGRIEEVSHTPSYVQSPLTEVSYSPQFNENPVIEPLVQNRGQTQPENAYNFENKQPSPSDYTGNLQDQSVRALLAPTLLLPTTEHIQSTADHEPPVEHITATSTTTTTTTTTTERPTTTHTTRGRGRQRGGSRFSTASATTSSSVPRRNVNRRRPVHASRTTTTESPNSQYDSKEDFQKVNTRQRFRTRGRPGQTTVADRVSSTENEVRSYKEPTSEFPSEIQTYPSDPQSYMKFEHTVEDQKLIIQSEDPPFTDPPQYYNPQPVSVTESPRLLIRYDNTATTDNPVMDIQITHPVPKIKKQPVVASRPSEEAQIHLQAGGVLHNNNNNNNNNNDYESPPRQKSRVRGRGRGRSRVATTTTGKPEISVVRNTARPVIRVAPKRTTTTSATTTTQKPSSKSIAENEFFGFIRQPNFNQIYNIQVPSATEQPLQIYENIPRVSTYHHVYDNQNKNPVRVQSYQIAQNTQQLDDVRLNFNSVPSDATTVRFLGEIRPKYRPTTQNYDEIVAATETINPIRVETETPRPRVRGRVRAPQRKPNARQSDNEIGTSTAQQATRRSNVIRSRGRGAAHYRAPENLRHKEDRDADVEGGNYPPSFFQNRQAATTNVPSFQISIDPSNEDDYADQLTNPSLYQPKILPKPDEWTEATENAANDEEYSPANDIHNDISLEKETVSPSEPPATEQPRDKDVTEDALATQQSKDIASDEQPTDRPIALPITAGDEQPTESSDEAYKKDTKAVEDLFEEINNTEKPKKGRGRRRGAWKLVRQRPVDTYEVAESQNYYSVVNAFGDIVKVKDKTNLRENVKDKDSGADLGHHQSYNNYNPVLEQNSDAYDYESQKLSPTENTEHQPTKYYEVHDLEAESENISSTVKPENLSSDNGTEFDNRTTPKESSIFETIYEMFGISDKSEDVKEPSTTTVLTAEPETVPPITTTVMAPTFPEEITEIPTTVAPSELHAESDNTEHEEDESSSTRTQITRTYEVEPWEMKAIRTSTSTEISHETEICYRGRCVKSADRTGS